MAEWAPVAFGFGLLALLAGAVLLFPESWLGTELRRDYQVQSSGVLGRFTSRDFMRSAGMSFVIAGLLTGSSVLALTVSFRKQDTVARLLEAYGFGFFLLAGVALLATGQTVVRGVRLYRFERRVARRRVEEPQLFAALHDIVRRYDPLGVESLQEPAEYEYQAGRLLVALPECRSYDEVLIMVRSKFFAWFPWAPPSTSRLAPLAQELWNLLPPLP